MNSKSGGQQGPGLLEKFKAAIPESQVFDLSNGGPEPGLQHWKETHGLRVLVCGGDGTAGWVMATFDKMQLPKPYPPVAVLPLGTGNDLARTLGWGGGYKGESIESILKKLEASNSLPMDRWTVKTVQTTPLTSSSGAPPANPHAAGDKDLVMNNYLSIGLDAKIALEFHQMREKNPHYFKSQLVNKAWYANYGLKNIVSNLELGKVVKLEIDSAVYVFPETMQGIIVLNVPSYAGGASLWDPEKEGTKYSAPAISDGMLEVVGITSTAHLGQIQMKLTKAIKIGQGRSIRITHTSEMPMQVDGEPWIAHPGVITITHLNQSMMLSYTKPKKTLLGSIPFGKKKDKSKGSTLGNSGESQQRSTTG